jgi:hypothetical protein
MPDTTNGPLDPADPPETHPPGTTPQIDSSEELAEAQVADPPETHPPNT